jgi:hypothetical protein
LFSKEVFFFVCQLGPYLSFLQNHIVLVGPERQVRADKQNGDKEPEALKAGQEIRRDF